MTSSSVMVIVAMIVATVSTATDAEDSSSESVREIDFFALPVELDMDSGAENGDANILRLLPLYSIALGENARLVNLNVVTFANTPGGVPGRPGNPDALPGRRTTGISDLIHSSLYTPNASKKTSFGIGESSAFLSRLTTCSAVAKGPPVRLSVVTAIPL